jgi:hypothetical protein
MTNQEKLLKKLGFKIEDLEAETFDLDSSLKEFYDSKVDFFLSREEIKTKIDKARVEGKIIATKDAKKLIKKRYGIELAIDDAEQDFEFALNEIDKVTEKKLESAKGSESEVVLTAKKEAEEWTEKFVGANKKIEEIEQSKLTEIETVKNDYEKKIKDKDKFSFIQSDLAKEKYVLETSDAYDVFLAKLSKLNLHIEIIEGNPVVLNEKGEKAMNSNNTGFYDYNSLKEDCLGKIKVQSHGNDKPADTKLIVTDNMSEEQKQMIQHLATMQ